MADTALVFTFSCEDWIDSKSLCLNDNIIPRTRYMDQSPHVFELHWPCIQEEIIIIGMVEAKRWQLRVISVSRLFEFVWLISTLELVLPLNRAKSGKIGNFQTFEVWTFVPAIFWVLVPTVCVVKMLSDRKEKIPGTKIPLGITYVGTSGRLHEAVGICAWDRPKYLNALLLFWLKELLIKSQKSFCFCNFH